MCIVQLTWCINPSVLDNRHDVLALVGRVVICVVQPIWWKEILRISTTKRGGVLSRTVN